MRSRPQALPAPHDRVRVLPPVPSVPKPPRAVMAQALASETCPSQAKATQHRDQRIRDSARGETCLVRLPGCPCDPASTIWSHYRGTAGGKGMGLKSHDIAGAYACTYCDAIYDGQRPRPAGMSKEQVDLAWHQGHIRSLGRLHEKGML